MKRALFFCLTLMALNAMYAQSFSDRFDDAFAANDVAAQRQALLDWERSAPEDVNLIIDIEPLEAKKLMQLIELLFEKWYIARHEEEALLAEITTISARKETQRQL